MELRDAINEVQVKLNLPSPRCNSILTLLNFFDVPRDEASFELYEYMKGRFEDQLRALDEEKLLILLHNTKQFLQSESLRFIPLLVMKKIQKQLPKDVLDLVIQYNILQVRLLCIVSVDL